MSRTRVLCAALVAAALAAPAARSQQPPRQVPEQLPPDLALVPADAIAFVHVRVGDALRSEQFNEFRELIRKAGPEALETFSRRFTPDPATLDRVTGYVLAPAPGGGEPTPVVVFRFSKPFDPAAVKHFLLPGGRDEQAGGATFTIDRAKDLAVRVIDRQTFLLCPPERVAAVAAAPARAGTLAQSVARAAEGRAVLTAAMNLTLLPPQTFAGVPPAVRPLTLARLATLTVEPGTSPRITLRLRFADEPFAKQADEALRQLAQMGLAALGPARAELNKHLTGNGQPGTLEQLPEAAAALVGLGALAEAEEFLKAPPLKQNGPELVMAVQVPPGLRGQLAVGGAVLPGLLLPAVQKVRAAAARTQSMNNLKQIGLALHNFHDANRAFPAHAIYSRDGKPLLSWRVAILPYIEQDALYRQFKLDEPWDSEHNKKLIAQMPKIYLPPDAPPTTEPGQTYYRAFVGGGAVFERGPRARKITEIADGTSNTILVVEAAEPAVWTKPDDLPYDPAKPLPKLGTAWRPAGFLALLADGSVRMVAPTIGEKTLRAAITAAGGEPLGADW